METVLIDDVEWLPYSTTIQMLQSISVKTNGKILSKPLVKIEEEGLIVGIITETNQFVYLNPRMHKMQTKAKYDQHH